MCLFILKVSIFLNTVAPSHFSQDESGKSRIVKLNFYIDSLKISSAIFFLSMGKANTFALQLENVTNCLKHVVWKIIAFSNLFVDFYLVQFEKVE